MFVFVIKISWWIFVSDIKNRKSCDDFFYKNVVADTDHQKFAISYDN